MPTPRDLDRDLEELSAWIAEHHDRIPDHRRLQALRYLERVEQLITDTEAPE